MKFTTLLFYQHCTIMMCGKLHRQISFKLKYISCKNLGRQGDAWWTKTNSLLSQSQSGTRSPCFRPESGRFLLHIIEGRWRVARVWGYNPV